MSALVRFAGGRRNLVVLLAVSAMAASSGPLVLLWRGSRAGAEFSATRVVGINRLSSATVDIEAGPGAAVANAALSVDNLAPGDREVGVIEVRNRGSVAVRWSARVEPRPDPLAAALRWELWPAADRAGCEVAPGASPAASADPATALGDPAPGADPGDQTLAVGGAAAVCVAVTLPIDATDALQGRRFEQVFVIAAEQADIAPPATVPPASTAPATVGVDR